MLSTPSLTLLACHHSRGREAIEEIGVLPGYRGVIVHDGLALYDGLGQASHAQCNAHLLRHLAAVGVVWDQEAWTEAMTEVLIEAKVAADDARQRGLRRVAPARPPVPQPDRRSAETVPPSALVTGFWSGGGLGRRAAPAVNLARRPVREFQESMAKYEIRIRELVVSHALDLSCSTVQPRALPPDGQTKSGVVVSRRWR